MTEQVYNSNSNQTGALTSSNQSQNINQAKPVSESPSNPAEPSLSPAITANLTSNLNVINQNELKVNRIQMLRILALKTAAILDWNLVIFEKE